MIPRYHAAIVLAACCLLGLAAAAAFGLLFYDANEPIYLNPRGPGQNPAARISWAEMFFWTWLATSLRAWPLLGAIELICMLFWRRIEQRPRYWRMAAPFVVAAVYGLAMMFGLSTPLAALGKAEIIWNALLAHLCAELALELFWAWLSCARRRQLRRAQASMKIFE